MQKLENFLAIIGLIEFLKRSYEFLKDKNSSKKVQSFFYHKNSLKVLAAYLVGNGALVLYINFLIYNIIFLSLQLSNVGMFSGMLVFTFLTIISLLALSKFYHFHKNEVEKYAL
jgi:hypothetical protein